MVTGQQEGSGEELKDRGGGDPTDVKYPRWRISRFLTKILYVWSLKSLAFWNTGSLLQTNLGLALPPDRYRSSLILLFIAAVANGGRAFVRSLSHC